MNSKRNSVAVRTLPCGNDAKHHAVSANPKSFCPKAEHSDVDFWGGQMAKAAIHDLRVTNHP